MASHPDLAAEQAYIDNAYACLESSRQAASRLTSMVEVGRGGTEQARFEREVIYESVVNRLTQLQLGDAALCFGRIDRAPEAPGEDPETFYIGRIAVSDAEQEPVIVDWRAPVAEPFYRATGRQPMGLARRRHFATRGRQLLSVEDELFGDTLASLGVTDESGEREVTGQGALFTALETARTGRLTDIVATIQGEQDEIIRAPLPGVLVVQGGPGTGKTVVALHRAAYLLYTHRFPLEGQGVLVIGPNRLFLGYIEQVLPSLGEAGVELAVLADLVPDVSVRTYDRGLTSRVKGDPRMVRFLARAVRDRERGLRSDLVVGYGLQRLTLSRERSQRIVADARRRYRRHNGARKYVEGEVFAELALSGHGDLVASEVRERLRRDPSVREALEWMWPVLSPAQLLHDLFGGKALLRHAGRDLFDDGEWLSLYRSRSDSLDQVAWTHDDAPLLDEARSLLGPKPKRRRPGEAQLDDEIRTYGHIVIDEVQDLSPMALRMAARRSLNGSMTVVGDLAQATGEHAPASWDDVLAHLPDRKPPRLAELTVGYRIPETIMQLADRVAARAVPGLTPPRAVRMGEHPPVIVGTTPDGLATTVIDEVRRLQSELGDGVVAVIAPDTLASSLYASLTAAGLEVGQATRTGLDQPVTLVPVSLVKGLELDGVVVVEPARIVSEQAQGLRALYVALTRSTRELSVVHAEPLPF